MLLGKLRKGAGDDEPVFRFRKHGALQSVAVLRRGAPIHLVQATLGHASITTTGRYLHARPKDNSSRFLAI